MGMWQGSLGAWWVTQRGCVWGSSGWVVGQDEESKGDNSGKTRGLREKRGATEGRGWCLGRKALRAPFLVASRVGCRLILGPHWEPGVL